MAGEGSRPNPRTAATFGRRACGWLRAPVQPCDRPWEWLHLAAARRYTQATSAIKEHTSPEIDRNFDAAPDAAAHAPSGAVKPGLAPNLAWLVAAGILLSRIAGLIRESVFAH